MGKQKARLKIAVDVLMSLALLFLMGDQFWGDVAHEWVGAGMFLLFILHHILNRRWYLSLFKGKYTPYRIFQLVIDLLLLLAMLGLMVSGVMLSNHVFAFLNLRGGISFARLLHMASSFWGFLLMGLHLGLHWQMFLHMTAKLLRLKNPSRPRRILLQILGAAIAVYGLISLIRRDIPSYLFLQNHFVFLDYTEPLYRFYLDYLAITGTCLYLSHTLSAFLKTHTKKSHHPQTP